MPTNTSSEDSILAAWAGAPGIDQHWKSSSGKGVLGRARVTDLLEFDRDQALHVARDIEHPWYRCQALSSIVEANPTSRDAEVLLVEALNAAYSQAEPNRVVSVARWPMRVIVLANARLAAEHLAKLLDVIAMEPHGLRRLDGICSILVAVAVDRELRKIALAEFRAALPSSNGWRTERIVNVAAHVLAPHDISAATQLLESRPVNRYTKTGRALVSSLLVGSNADT